MRPGPALPVLLLLTTLAWSGPPPVNYSVRLRLDEVAHTLLGTEEVTYRNLSADTLDAIWLHAYPNALANRATEYARELERQGRFDFSLAPASARGWMQVNRAEANSITVEPRMHGTELELPLSSPLVPGDSVLLELDFATRLPELPGMFGHKGQTFVLAHCFPQVAARSGHGWHAEGYHVFGRSPAEFADYDVSINVPEHLSVVASGAEFQTDSSPARRQVPTPPDRARVFRFVAGCVDDFALVAFTGCRQRQIAVDGVTVEAVYRGRPAFDWPDVLRYARDIVPQYSQWYGPCPARRLTVVQADGIVSADASYPGLVLVAQGPVPATRLYEQVLARQIALQWFGPGVDMLASPWLALGPATHAEMRYMQEKYGSTNLLSQPLLEPFFSGLSAEYLHRATWYYAASNHVRCDSVRSCPDRLGYEARHQSLPGLLLRAEERRLGTSRFDSLMRGYTASSHGQPRSAAGFEQHFPGFSSLLTAPDPADTFIPSRLNARRLAVSPIIGLPSFSTYQVFYGPYAWLDNYHGVQLQAWLMGRLFVDGGPLRGRHMWTLSETYSTRLGDWHTSFSYSSPVEFISNRLRLLASFDYSLVEAGAKVNLVHEFGPAFRQPRLTVDLGYRFLDLYDLRLRDRRAWDSAAFSDVRLKLFHTYECRNFRGSQRLYLARGIAGLGVDSDYWKSSIEQTHTFRWRANAGVTLRAFGGTVSGLIPAQEQFYLSGGLTTTTGEPVSWGYKGWTSGQERWHYDADANLRGYAGEYAHGRHAWGLNLYFAPVRFVQPFFDVGNVGDTLDAGLFQRPRMDAGIRLRLGPLYADFPFWRYDMDDGHQLDFRWVLGFKLSEMTAAL